MAERIRHKYRFDLDGWALSATGVSRGVIRPLQPEDTEALAGLMLDAYLGTIDYEGENIDDARAEIDEYLASDPILPCTRVIEMGGNLVAACLVARWEDAPLIAYVMTSASRKGQGLARATLLSSLDCLARTTDLEVFAFITEGNTASERLFLGLGAVRID
jgi:hypothetical protein